MERKKLYAILLGGKNPENHLMEDHHIVFVVSEDETKAREKAKKKWNRKDIHIDGTQEIKNVDGHKIKLEKIDQKDDLFEVNQNYSK